jgi:hypothetical protein
MIPLEVDGLKPSDPANSSQVAAKSLLPPSSIAGDAEQGLLCFRQTRGLTDQENADLPQHWLFWRVDTKTVLSFSAPPVGSWNDAFKQELDAWPNFEHAKTSPGTNIVSSLVHEAVKMSLLRPDPGATADQKVLIPSGLTPDDKTLLKVGGHLPQNKFGELLQRCYRHLAIRHRIRQDLTKRYQQKAH